MPIASRVDGRITRRRHTGRRSTGWDSRITTSKSPATGRYDGGAAIFRPGNGSVVEGRKKRRDQEQPIKDYSGRARRVFRELAKRGERGGWI